MSYETTFLTNHTMGMDTSEFLKFVNEYDLPIFIRSLTQFTVYHGVIIEAPK